MAMSKFERAAVSNLVLAARRVFEQIEDAWDHEPAEEGQSQCTATCLICYLAATLSAVEIDVLGPPQGFGVSPISRGIAGD